VGNHAIGARVRPASTLARRAFGRLRGGTIAGCL
jgi:hypothetical protein